MNWKRIISWWILIYPVAGLILGVITYVTTGKLVGPEWSNTNFSSYSLLQRLFTFYVLPVYLIESAATGIIFVLLRERKEGWKTKVFLMGTTSLLSILIWILVNKLLPF